MDALRVWIFPSCIERRTTRAPFPSSKSPSTGILQLLQTEAMGDLPVACAGGEDFLVSVIEDCAFIKGEVRVRHKEFSMDAAIQLVYL